jgi:GntR family transcriptional regulator, transcriptional repressor for pyruvate dehydrogenase complex
MESSRPTPALPKTRSLAHGVVSYVADLIKDGRIAPGEKVPSEAEFIRALGVSRSVVREAISHMQAAGMVETRQGVGTFALAPRPPEKAQMGLDPETVTTMPDVLSILELRITLETEAAGLAAARRDEAGLADILAALQHFLNQCRDGGETATPDNQFHLAIARASGNRHLHDVLNYLVNTLLPLARRGSLHLVRNRPPIDISRVTREHEDIVNAIARQDPESARAAMRTHLSNSRERLRAAYEQSLLDNPG